MLEGLVEVAKIQSTEMSSRIENISTSAKRLRDLMADKVAPMNRDEREIAGYRYVLDTIHESHDDIPVTPNVILQLHRDLYRFSGDGFAGRWKDSDNVIAERAASGELVARFRPTSAAATPGAVERICEEYRLRVEQGVYDPLLVSLIFVFDFASVHPFSDGNGRTDRLLTLLLLYRSGYTVGKYVSIEKEIERTKETYYEALTASSVGWQDGENDYTPFVTYMFLRERELPKNLASAPTPPSWRPAAALRFTVDSRWAIAVSTRPTIWATPSEYDDRVAGLLDARGASAIGENGGAYVMYNRLCGVYAGHCAVEYIDAVEPVDENSIDWSGVKAEITCLYKMVCVCRANPMRAVFPNHEF